MSALSELLDGAVREDAVRLSDGSFAAARFGAVRGRIARRRAARSAGVGGASVLGIGVLAVGGSQLAGSNLGFVGPGLGASVVCTTATPESATDYASISAVQTSAGDDTDGSRKSWVIVSGSGGPNEKPLVSLHLDGEVLTVSIVDGDVQTLTPDPDGLYTVMLADGSTMTLEVTADEITIHSFPMPSATANAGAAPTTVVTCVTTTPEPSASASPSPSVTPSRTPDPEVSATQAAATSPFACGYVFDNPTHNSDGVAVTTTRWLSATEAVAALHDEYGSKIPSNVPTPTSGILAAGFDVSVTAPDGRDIQDAGGGVDYIDPAGYLDAHELAARGFIAGTTIVGVKDGKVVATVPTDRDPSLLGWSNIVGEADLALTVIDADAALAPCADSTTWTDIYVVTGIGLISGNEWLVDPVYAWTAVPPQP